MMEEIFILKKSISKRILYGILIVLSGGVFYLFCRWIKKMEMWLLYSERGKKELRGSYAKVLNADKNWEVCKMKEVTWGEEKQLVFEFRLYWYYVIEEQGQVEVIGVQNNLHE
jgi:hypothetical protein